MKDMLECYLLLVDIYPDPLEKREKMVSEHVQESWVDDIGDGLCTTNCLRCIDAASKRFEAL